MQNNKLNFGLLSGNQLKLLAAIIMTIDHIGLYFFQQIIFLQKIGRLAFPIFAYMIAEGCKYTKNRKKYLLTMVIAGAAFQIIYSLAKKSLSQSIFVTFSLSVALIFAIDKAKKDLRFAPLATGVFALIIFMTRVLPKLIPAAGFHIEYGLFGTLLPVLVYYGKGKWEKLLLFFLGLLLLSGTSSPLQWYSILALPVMVLYNGKRGKMKMKNFFYLYYPGHLTVIFIIRFLIK